MAIMVHPRICVDTGVLIRFLRGEEPCASALERGIRESDCYIHLNQFVRIALRSGTIQKVTR